MLDHFVTTYRQAENQEHIFLPQKVSDRIKILNNGDRHLVDGRVASRTEHTHWTLTVFYGHGRLYNVMR